MNTQTFICKVGRCDLHKIWCICPNWTIVFVQIEKISLSKLKKCICPNWTHVSVKVAKLCRHLFARGEIWWFIWSCSYSCSSPLKTIIIFSTSKQTHQNFKIYLSELTNIFVQITLYIILRRKTYTALTQSCFSSKTNSSQKKRGCPRQTNPKASTWSPNIFAITKYSL